MYILGINAYHGDAAASIVQDGQLIAAAEEERFNRQKHCAGFPEQAIRYCLEASGISIDQVDHIGISRNPSAHLHKKILFALTRVPNLSGLISARLANAAKIRDLRQDLSRALGVPSEKLQVHNVEHHLAHMASCFFVSPFERAAVLSIDGFGDFISTMWGSGQDNHLNVLGQIEYPHSAGAVYTATTQYLGFTRYGDEGKVMGLAPYGKRRYLDRFRDIIRTDNGGGFKLNLDYFLHHSHGVEMTWEEGSPTIGRMFSERFVDAFGPARSPGEPLSSKQEDIAASLQARLEEVAFHILNQLFEKTKLTQLCLAGGVALNSVMNGKILLRTPFKEVFVQPAAGDSGTAIGVCYYIYHMVLRQARSFVMGQAYTGPEFSGEVIEKVLKQSGLAHRKLTEHELTQAAAQAIADGKIVGWFQGRMEFGPRALGNRSIIVDPRRSEMKEILNSRIKKREPFRPFAPSILEERIGEYFEQTHPSPTMLMVYQVKKDKQSVIPAVTHVDGSGRLQTVSHVTNPRYYQLIRDFEKLTGVPVVLNTSFNEDEPIVCTPEEAVNCFQRTYMDVLFLDTYMVQR
ncbi:MAG TPA: carbamoyltransferase [Candidatus Sulfotelmatobacter sp.]